MYSFPRNRTINNLQRALVSVALISCLAAGSLKASDPWPANPNWQQYVNGPAAPDVYPVKVVTTWGSVKNADALVKQNGFATLQNTPGEPAPAIVLDYGKDVSGIPFFNVQSVSGTPTLHAAYSEGLLYLGTNGDGAPGQAADPSRADDFTLSGAGVVTRNMIQGGERFQIITLTSPGTVSLSAAGIHFSAFRADATAYQGYFVCNDDELNRIWYDGAYTVQLDQLPPGSVAPPWTITNGSLDANGGDVGLLKIGTNWTDYTVTFQFKIVTNQAGWLVRGQSQDQGYVLILNASNDTAGAPNTLQELSVSPSGYASIANVALPVSLDPGTQHIVKSVVSGTTVTTYLDNQQIASFDSSNFSSGITAYATGTVGFREHAGEEADFNNLTVTDPSASVLFSNPFSDPSALTAFNTPVGGDPLPLVMDGAKRDRVVWGGDLNIDGPTLYYSTATNEYIQQSLLLLGSYQEASGEAGSDVPPTNPLGTFPESGYSYSASYSIYFVLNLADYYLFTGDLAFVKKEWPIVQSELTYNAANVNSSNLLITSASDGMDWHYYDGALTGAVTEYNALYYQALLDGSVLAQAAGFANLAAGYEAQAALVKTAINSTLFNATTGVYDLSDSIKGKIAQDANSSVIVTGIAPTSAVSPILTTLQTALWTEYGPLSFSANTGFKAYISPFASKIELEARFQANDTTDALTLLHDLWGLMAAQDSPNYTASAWEVIGTDGTPGFAGFTSLAHGWSSGATSMLSGYVLGIRPIEPGYLTWMVEPHPGTLTWSEGRAPTAYGPFDVKWANNQSSHRFTLDVQVPPGTSGTIVLPPSTGTNVQVNGKTVFSNGQFKPTTGIGGASLTGGVVQLTGVQSGHYRIESQ
jgi:alpha-L-rhamnosidase